VVIVWTVLELDRSRLNEWVNDLLQAYMNAV